MCLGLIQQIQLVPYTPAKITKYKSDRQVYSYSNKFSLKTVCSEILWDVKEFKQYSWPSGLEIPDCVSLVILGSSEPETVILYTGGGGPSFQNELTDLEAYFHWIVFQI